MMVSACIVVIDASERSALAYWLPRDQQHTRSKRNMLLHHHCVPFAPIVLSCSLTCMRTLKLRARSQTMLALDYVVGEEAAGGQLICDVVGLFLYGPSRAVRRPRGASRR